MSSDSPRLDVLLAWCNDNGIQIDPKIHVIESGNHQRLGGDSSRSSSPDHGIAVYSLEDHLDSSCVRECSIRWTVAILAFLGILFQVSRTGRRRLRMCSRVIDLSILTMFISDIVVRIPKTSILSTKSCFLSQDITTAPYGHTAHLALALALYAEMYVFLLPLVICFFYPLLIRVFYSAPSMHIYPGYSYSTRSLVSSKFTQSPNSMRQPASRGTVTCCHTPVPCLLI